ncbi:unnamed protein product [Prorocentrum cordatum]|uniref:MRH domain-containing protein n=1 Tax=Prorocentrum cordatum TaxID=2364126 RepID=A0ABN9WC72_9DINO|nr:unnamed protein product [Polarella glacialis]
MIGGLSKQQIQMINSIDPANRQVAFSGFSLSISLQDRVREIETCMLKFASLPQYSMGSPGPEAHPGDSAAQLRQQRAAEPRRCDRRRRGRELRSCSHPEKVEQVYRLEPLEPDAPLEAEDVVLCRLPWGLDLAALEELHCELEDLRVEHKELQLQYSRTKEALMALSASAEANMALECGGDIAPQEVHQLRLQLAESERNQQETKATVIALRGEFMRLVEVWSDAGGPKRAGDLAFPAHDAEAARLAGLGGAPGGRGARRSLHGAAEALRAARAPGSRPASQAPTPAARGGGAVSPAQREFKTMCCSRKRGVTVASTSSGLEQEGRSLGALPCLPVCATSSHGSQPRDRRRLRRRRRRQNARQRRRQRQAQCRPRGGRAEESMTRAGAGVPGELLGASFARVQRAAAPGACGRTLVGLAALAGAAAAPWRRASRGGPPVASMRPPALAAVAALPGGAGGTLATMLRWSFVVSLDLEPGAGRGPGGAPDGQPLSIALAGGKQKLECRLPAAGGGRAAQEAQAQRQRRSIGAKLAQLRGYCWTLLRDGWEYQVCPGDGVKRRMSDAPASRGQGWQSLGSHVAEADALRADGGVTELFLGGAGNASSEIWYVCGSSGAEKQTISLEISEGELPVYSWSISGPAFCSWGGRSGSRATTLAGEEIQASALLEDLRGSCLNLTRGWWSYEYCFPGRITQFHQWPWGRREPEHSLGSIDMTGAEAGVDRVQMSIVRLKPGHPRATPSARRALWQRLEGGSVCDETQRARATSMLFRCPPNWQSRPRARIASVEETSVCEYEVRVETVLLCGHDMFLPPPPPEEETIQCTARREDL